MEKAESVVLKKIHSSLHFVLKDVTVVMVNFSMKANVSLKTNVLASTMVINILLGLTFSKTAMNGKIFFKDLFLLIFLNFSICKDSKWQCTNNKCDRRCSAIGDPHYKTFDGHHYDFMGQCSYTLVKHQDFEIQAENAECSSIYSEDHRHYGVNNPPTCTKAISILFNNSKLKLKQRREIVYNGEEVLSCPKKLDNEILLQTASSLWMTGEKKVVIE